MYRGELCNNKINTTRPRESKCNVSIAIANSGLVGIKPTMRYDEHTSKSA